MIPTEIDRLAHAVSILRPDWPKASLRTFITANLAERPYRDAAVAFAFVSCDPDTRTPARVLEAGPWWAACKPADAPPPKTLADPIPQTMRCGVCYRDQPGHDHANAIVAEEARHDWITERDLRLRRKPAPRPRQEPTQ